MRIRVGFFLILFLAGLGYGVGLLSYNDTFAISDVQITGNSTLPEAVVRAAFEVALYDGTYHFFSRGNIFLYPRAHLSNELLTKLPRLKKVSMSRESLMAQAVMVSVEEREARYLWCSLESCYVMDAEGFIFDRSGASGGEYTFRGGLSSIASPIGQTFLRTRLPDILDLFERLHAAGYKALGATVENDKDFTVTLEREFNLKASFDSEPGDVVRNLELILASDALKDNVDALDYVDLRFGNRVYYQLE